MKEALRWLCMMPLASADNLAQVTRLSRAMVNRQLAGLYNDGLALSPGWWGADARPRAAGP